MDELGTGKYPQTTYPEAVWDAVLARADGRNPAVMVQEDGTYVAAFKTPGRHGVEEVRFAADGSQLSLS